MADVTVKRLDEFETMSHAGLTMFRVRTGLGVSSFGVQVITIPPGNENYPEHDHSEDGIGGRMFEGRPGQLGQEEVYTALEGSATLIADDQRWALEPRAFARVGAAQKRKILPGSSGVKLLAIGGIPGRAFTA